MGGRRRSQLLNPRATKHIERRGMQGEPESRPARARVAAVLVLRRPHRLELLGEGLHITRTQPHASRRLVALDRLRGHSKLQTVLG